MEKKNEKKKNVFFPPLFSRRLGVRGPPGGLCELFRGPPGLGVRGPPGLGGESVDPTLRTVAIRHTLLFYLEKKVYKKPS